jgi:glycosyltransferase involved in cell wall biosynthesis
MPKTGPVLILSHDVVGQQMAGPGIRYYHLARVLAREFDVILAAPPGSTVEDLSAFKVLLYTSGQDPALEAAVQQARAVFTPAVVVTHFPFLFRTETPIIVDGYNPFLAETLVIAPENARAQQAALTQACLLGDFFVCASERQRDWWLGYLEATGRVNRYTHAADPSLRQLVDLVPFGLPEGEPQRTRPVIKGVWPGVAATDRVVLWGGGVWPWLDPLTAIRAMSDVIRHRPDVRLVFPGTRHPNPVVAQASAYAEVARALAEQLGLLDKAVFFGDWVKYADWPSVLLESDLAVTLSPGDTLETRLAFRSRVLDYVWASLPIVTTRGDAASELVATYGVGHVVGAQSAEMVAQAILELLDTSREQFASGFIAAQQALTWEQAAQPLINFCRQTRCAADKAALGSQLGNAYYVSEMTRWQSAARTYEALPLVRFWRWWQSVPARWQRVNAQ